MPDPALPPEIALTHIDPHAPLVVLDVDEVLAMFMHGFGRFVSGHGYEMRISKFALFQNIYRAGHEGDDAQCLDLERGRELFDAFFASDVEHIDAAPGAREAVERLARRATVVVLTNAPAHGRDPRARWLVKSGFPYPLIINAGLKGPAVAALSARTRGPVAFVDDLLPNLESVAASAPEVLRFQHVADERLRPFAPMDAERHVRIDDWPGLGHAIARALDLAP